MRRRFALFGHPVAHSLSPRIHAAFARQAGIDMDYSPIDTEALDAALAAFDGDGANVTLPHKQRAAELCVALGEPGRVHPRYFDDLQALGEFDLVVNATSAGRHGALPTLPMSLAGPRTAAVDLSYGEAAIPFLAWARAAGAREAIDGLGMLVEQAAESFRLWHGVRPETGVVFAALQADAISLVSAD